MKALKTILKVTGITLGILFITFFVYANLEKPSLGEQVYMSHPTGIALLSITGKVTEHDVAAQLKKSKGVTSHTYIPGDKTLVVTYSKNETGREEIVSGLLANGISAVEKKIAEDKPQCPVHGYLDAFYQAKYALNIRK